MKASLTMEGFPMLLVDVMVADLKKRLPTVDVQVGGEDTVYVSFTTDDIVKTQELSIICDLYYHGGGSYGPLLPGDDEQA